jgi:thiosulfate/3-mercaptopyruvate sulfurtransferase
LTRRPYEPGSKAEVEPGEPVIIHRQSGGQALADAFVFERLGFPTRNDDLGWSDWGNADETPVEAGTDANPKR